MAKHRGSSFLNWWIILLALGAAIGGGTWYYLRHQDSAPEYQTVTVTKGDITQVVTATGQLNPVVNVQVGSQISGIIEKLLVDYNSSVKSNQVIAQLDPATYLANLHQAEGDLANAKAALELAQVNARRSRELLNNKLIAQSDYDTTEATLHQSDAQVKIKDAALERARVDLERCTIEAPVDGVVISRNVDVGQTVAASLQAPTLFIIANDLTKMQIDANVAEADVGGVEDNQDVDFTVDAFPYRTFHGKVVQVRNAPITVQNVVTYDTVISVSNPDLKLKPGMTANVSIIIARRQGVLKVPNAALRFRPPETAAAEIKTNLAVQAAALASSGGGPARMGREGGGGGNGGGGGGRGPGGFSGAGGPGGRPRGERPTSRTVYVLQGQGDTAKPDPVQVKTGISDGVNTEIIEGVAEDAKVVTGIISTEGGAGPMGPRPANPFGGGGFRRF
jgi:HlyD family secretion protein